MQRLKICFVNLLQYQWFTLLESLLKYALLDLFLQNF